MRRLMLFRHAKSDRNQPGKSDHERVLSARGAKDAPLMGASAGLTVVLTNAVQPVPNV